MRFDLSGFLDETRPLNIRGVSVWRDGEETACYEPGKPVSGNLYSATKSFLSAAAGLAAAEKLFSLEDRVVDSFADELPGKISGQLEEMRLKHLLTMTMGIPEALLMGEERPALRLSETDWVKYCLQKTVVRKPGTVFQYSNAGPYLLGVLIQKRSGQNLLEYLKPRLLDPLEIAISQWETCPQGFVFGASGFWTDLEGFSRFGRLYLQNGSWQNRQILPEEWVKASGRQQIPVSGDDKIGRGYGYCFWTLPENAWRAEGKYGQYCLICPERNAVVTIMADNRREDSDRPVLRAAMHAIVMCL